MHSHILYINIKPLKIFVLRACFFKISLIFCITESCLAVRSCVLGFSVKCATLLSTISLNVKTDNHQKKQRVITILSQILYLIFCQELGDQEVGLSGWNQPTHNLFVGLCPLSGYYPATLILSFLYHISACQGV